MTVDAPASRPPMGPAGGAIRPPKATVPATARPQIGAEARSTLSLQLGPEEAIVLIGLTPPPARYFGFYPYRRTQLKPDGTRQSLWTSLGDAVNNATVKTTGPTPFNSPVALIFTPDEKTDGRAASQGADDSGDRVRGL